MGPWGVQAQLDGDMILRKPFSADEVRRFEIRRAQSDLFPCGCSHGLWKLQDATRVELTYWEHALSAVVRLLSPLWLVRPLRQSSYWDLHG